MEKRGKVLGGVIIDVNATNTKGYVDQFPTASESDLKPSLVSTGEPEPFDPLSAINSVKRSNIVSGTVEVSDELDAAAEAVTANATSEKEETPTPESVAAELHEVAEHAQLVDDELEEEERKTITQPVPVESPKKKKIIPIVAVVLLFMALAVGAYIIFTNSNPGEKEQSSTRVADNRPKNTDYDYVIGSWESQAEGGSCYVFTEDQEFYWLRDSEDFNDNYYYGKVISIDRGAAALRKSGTTFNNAKQMFQIKDEAITEDNIFFLNLQATERKIGGVDTSSTLGTSPIKILFVRDDNNNKAYGYQYNSGDMYVFANNPEIVAPARQK